MDPKRKRELEIELELRRRRAIAKQSGESEGSDDGEGEYTPAPSKAGETTFDAIQGGTRGVTLGLNDVVAGLGAAAGDLYQSFVDDRPRNPNAYAEGVAEERARDEASRERSPRAFKRAELAGLVATAPLVAAKPVQLAARGASGAPVAVGAVVDAAAPVLTRYGRAAAAGALTGLGLGDVDKIEDVPGTAATGAALGLGGEALSTAVKSGMATGIGPSDLVRAGSLKSADALKALIGKADEAPIVRGALALPTGGASEAALLSARGAEKALRRIGTEAVPPAPVPVFKPTATAPVDDAMAAGLPTAKPNPLAALVDEPMPTMPPRNPRTPLDQIPKPMPAPAPAPVPAPTPAVTPGGAVPLSDAELQAMIRGVNSSPQMRQLEVVQQQMAKRAPGVATDPLDEMSKRLIRQGNASTTNTNPVAITDDVTRTPKVVAAVGQQERWRAIYDSLKKPEQRAAYIEQLRRESGLTDDQIRQRLKLTMAEWRRKSFTREAP